jgi:hypothetical protein
MSPASLRPASIRKNVASSPEDVEMEAPEETALDECDHDEEGKSIAEEDNLDFVSYGQYQDMDEGQVEQFEDWGDNNSSEDKHNEFGGVPPLSLINKGKNKANVFLKDNNKGGTAALVRLM